MYECCMILEELFIRPLNKLLLLLYIYYLLLALWNYSSVSTISWLFSVSPFALSSSPASAYRLSVTSVEDHSPWFSSNSPPPICFLLALLLLVISRFMTIKLSTPLITHISRKQGAHQDSFWVWLSKGSCLMLRLKCLPSTFSP